MLHDMPETCKLCEKTCLADGMQVAGWLFQALTMLMDFSRARLSACLPNQLYRFDNMFFSIKLTEGKLNGGT
jgi:hypothetical protein